MMTLLQIVQEFCRRQGLPKPATVVNNTDTSVQQFLGFCNETLDEVSARQEWTGVRRLTTWTGVNALIQGNVYTLFGSGYKWINPETFWDLTARIPVGGPMSAEDWQRALAIPFTGPFYRYRIQQDNLMLYPAPPATPAGAHTYSVEWCDENMVNVAAAGGNAATTSKYFVTDTDTPIVKDSIFILGCRWRWRAEKGLPYLEHHKSYEVALNEMMGHDGGKVQLDIADGIGDQVVLKPGIFVPAGNWPVS